METDWVTWALILSHSGQGIMYLLTRENRAIEDKQKTCKDSLWTRKVAGLLKLVRKRNISDYK